LAIQDPLAEKIVAALQEFGFDLPEVTIDLLLKENQITRMGVPPVRIEITATISSVSFDSSQFALNSTSGITAWTGSAPPEEAQ
jgi:hypothetical protein